MNEITLQSIEAYDKDFQSFGACPKGVGWGNNAKNIRKRYNNFVNLANLSAIIFSNIIDLGCGYGEFLNYTASLNLTKRFQYNAVEPNIKLLSNSKHLIAEIPNHKDILVRKYNLDVIQFSKLSESLNPKIPNTLMICNGVFTQKFKTSSNNFEDFLMENLCSIFSILPLSSLFIFNTMHPHPSYKLDNLFYPSNELIEFLEVKSRSFDLDLTIKFDEILCESYYCFKRK